MVKVCCWSLKPCSMGDKLTEALRTMGAPSTDDPAELEEWMLTHLQGTGRLPSVKQEEGAVSFATKSLHSPQLRISCFSGEKGKDTPFDLWIYEVRCLVREKEYSEVSIQQAVRRSLKGEAARCVMRLTEMATLTEVLAKLEAVFSEVESAQTVMEEFYSAHQRSDESVAAWGCRLEDLLERAKHQGFVSTNVNDLLRTRFWNGLTQKLKDVSRYKFEMTTDFDQLRTAMRVIEMEHQGRSGADQNDRSGKKVQNKMAVAGDTSQSDGGELKELKGIIHKLSNQVESMEKQISQGKSNGKPGTSKPDGKVVSRP